VLFHKSLDFVVGCIDYIGFPGFKDAKTFFLIPKSRPSNRLKRRETALITNSSTENYESRNEIIRIAGLNGLPWEMARQTLQADLFIGAF
jgi:hypothetical protein